MDFLPLIGLLMLLVKIDAGSVNIELQVLQFNNPTGTSYYGSDFKGPRKCCDLTGNTSCINAPSQDYCDTFITICIGRITTEGCTSQIFTTLSRPLINHNSYTTARSPVFKVTRELNDWKTNSTELIINISDNDNVSSNDLIDDLKAIIRVVPAQTYFKAMSNIINMKNHASVDLELRVWCKPGLYGVNCEQPCDTDSYHSCMINGTTLLDTCSGADAMSIQYDPDTNFEVYKRLVLRYVGLRLCDDDSKVIMIDVCKVTDTKSRMDFKAQCDNTSISGLALSHSLLIDSIAFRSGLKKLFNGFNPSLNNVTTVSMLEGQPLSVNTMVKIVGYQDPERRCVSNRTIDCLVTFNVCFGRLSENRCESAKSVSLRVLQQGPTLTSTGDHLYDPSIPNYNNTEKTTFLIQLSQPPELHGNVKYGAQPRGIFNNRLRSLSIGNSYVDARPQLFQFEFGKRRLDIEIMAWCSDKMSGIRCRCTVSGLNHKCDSSGRSICAEGYAGPNCTDIDECKTGSPCKHGGTCTNTIGNYQCACINGWTGQSCQIDMDECSLGVCINSVNCTNTSGNYSCSCLPGFTGLDCSIDQDECNLSQPCKYNGTCFNTYGDYFCECPGEFSGRNCEVYLPQNHELVCGYHTVEHMNTTTGVRCICLEGWSGLDCSKDVNECDNTSVCNGGQCHNVPGNFSCDCSDGWEGTHCLQDVNECLNKSNCLHGKCINTDGSYMCLCVAGWFGSKCDEDVNECVNTPNCVHGNCSNTDGSYNCSCVNGWSGARCDRDRNECGDTTSTPCSNNGTCLNTPGSYQCSCLFGWTGLSCEDDLNECEILGHNPCAHNSTCANTIGSYTCSCSSGFTGHNCRDDINECLNDLLCINGVCNNSIGGYTCSCYLGWTGHDCKTDVDECVKLGHNPCAHNSTCVNALGSYTCSCKGGFSGHNCRDDINECLNDSLCNNGICVNSFGGYNCSCNIGWEGKYCDIDINECVKLGHNPCAHNSSCVNALGSYTCSCKGGFSGHNCRDDINECLDNSLCHNGICVNSVGGYNCSCNLGWEGQYCDIDINECTRLGHIPCANNGSCTNTAGSFYCTCSNGWSGNYCHTDVDECLINTRLCQNGATCLNIHGGYRCQCSDGWSGLDCTSDIDECLSSPCHNNGTCINYAGAYACNCSGGWSGLDCTEDLNECLSDVCKNNASCLNTDGSYKCLCLEGFNGTNCSMDVNECLDNQCVHGTCENTFGSFQCECISGWSGTYCNTDIDECKLGIGECFNDGTCSNIDGYYICKCKPHWSGNQCESFVDFCLPNPCQNNGICTSGGSGSYTCHCTPQWMGTHCSVDIDECESQPCKHNGTCVNFEGGFHCNCSSGFNGSQCQTHIDLCERIECLNNGTCVAYGTGIGICECDSLYSGTHCQHKRSVNKTQTLKTLKPALQTTYIPITTYQEINITSVSLGGKTRSSSNNCTSRPDLITTQGIIDNSTTLLRINTTATTKSYLQTSRYSTNITSDSSTKHFDFQSPKSTRSDKESTPIHRVVTQKFTPLFTNLLTSSAMQQITEEAKEYFTIFFQCTQQSSNESFISKAIKDTIPIHICKERRNIKVQFAKSPIKLRNSLKFRVFCDEKLIPSQAVEKAFHSFSEEKLNSLFPCKHKEGKTDQSKISSSDFEIPLIACVAGIFIVAIVVIGIITIHRRQKIHKHEDMDMKETPRQRGQDNPLYLTFDKMDTDA